MNGLNKTMTKAAVLKATAKPPKEGDFVWDGKDADNRPLSKQEMREGIKNPGGRPKSNNPKVPVTIRLSPEVAAHFRATGKGWQTRLDGVLKEYVEAHSS